MIEAPLPQDEPLKQDFLRETDFEPAGQDENPSDTIKWTLGNLLNKMEGKPQI